MEIQDLGPLFEAVQSQRLFDDGKTFVDSWPKNRLKSIAAAYARESKRAEFDLRAFVDRHFEMPEPESFELATGDVPVVRYISSLWKQLTRPPDPSQEGSTLLPLPHPYLIPGGHFREIYYWDSYFTMLGLRVSGEDQLLRSMIANFGHLIDKHGYIPNGNRSYFLGRSQPPFFALMLDLLAELHGPSALLSHEKHLRTEYAYWMDEGEAQGHVVEMPDGSRLNRYYAQTDEPRPESFAEDRKVAERSGRPAGEVLRHITAAAESGWDFGSRWFADGRTKETIRTCDCVPCDLNALLHRYETTLARICRMRGETAEQEEWTRRAAERREAVMRYCWSDEHGFFGDYILPEQQFNPNLTAAGVVPLYLGLPDEAEAAEMAKTIESRFLKHGGIVMSLVETGEQWDAPNGLAPLEWMTICGLERYGHRQLAEEISRRWVRLNTESYERFGHFMEKYDVVDERGGAGGNYAPTQEGFGWTNGVLQALLKNYRPRHQ